MSDTERLEPAEATDGPGRLWCLVLPVKRLSVAKTRLGSPYDGHRRPLALAFAVDTAAAALRCPLVAGVVVVTDEPDASEALVGLGATVLADEADAGLNPALRHGAATARRLRPRARIGALAGDLPALRPDDLAVALAAAGRGRSFVRDADGTGTTLLLAGVGADLQPEFGPASALRHQRSGASDLLAGESLSSLRRDVDTAGDLAVALALGVGAATTRALDAVAAVSAPRAG